eukprot:13209352-Alexandrium_andersonii.AAC.1
MAGRLRRRPAARTPPRRRRPCRPGRLMASRSRPLSCLRRSVLRACRSPSATPPWTASRRSRSCHRRSPWSGPHRPATL